MCFSLETLKNFCASSAVFLYFCVPIVLCTLWYSFAEIWRQSVNCGLAGVLSFLRITKNCCFSRHRHMISSDLSFYTQLRLGHCAKPPLLSAFFYEVRLPLGHPCWGLADDRRTVSRGCYETSATVSPASPRTPSMSWAQWWKMADYSGLVMSAFSNNVLTTRFI